MMLRTTAVVLLLLGLGQARAETPALPQGPREEALLDAVLLGDAKKVQALLDQGASPEARNLENDRTALFFAAEKGNAEIVKLLLAHGANIDAVEKEHRERPLSAAARRGHPEVVRLILAKDERGAASVALNAVYQNNPAILDEALATGRLSKEEMSLALELAERQGSSEVAAHLRKSGIPPLARGVTVPPTTLARYAGLYQSEEGFTLKVSLDKESLFVAFASSEPIRLAPLEPAYFTAAEGPVAFRLRFEVTGGRVHGVTSQHIGSLGRFKKAEASAP